MMAFVPLNEFCSSDDDDDDVTFDAGQNTHDPLSLDMQPTLPNIKQEIKEQRGCATAGPSAAASNIYPLSGIPRLDDNSSHECDSCGKTFQWKCNLDDHIRIHLQPCSCTLCGREFARISHFNQHRCMIRRSDSTNLPEIPCVEKQFSESSRQKTTNVDKKPFNCHVCQKRFHYNAGLSRHMVLHTREKRFKCTVCNMTFVWGAHLNRHLSRSEKRVRCKICEKVFCRSSQLASHMRVHRPERPHTCAVCAKSFSDNLRLTRHMHFHTREKQYKCTECNKRFYYSSSLNRHVRSHAESFTCDTCSNVFTNKRALRRHVRRHSAQ